MPAHTHCRICRSSLPEPFLDLGMMPLANSFLSDEAEFASELRYPLAAAGCTTCGLVQLNFVVPAEDLYRDYIYVSSTSVGVTAHAEHLASELVGQYRWGPADLVIEVASNDGTVLQAFKRAGVRVLGVEPALNIASLARAAGVPTIPEFFNMATARAVVAEHGRAVAVLGRHVFAHVDDVHDFMEAASYCLADGGVFLVEVPYLGSLLRHMEFDTIYHEHLSYFSLGAIRHLCKQHDLELADVEQIELHGGSVILHIRRQGLANGPSARVAALLAEEGASGLTDHTRLAAFADAVRSWKDRFEGLIVSLQRAGATLIGYGAAAKANTLLNFCPVAAGSLAYILDRSPHKQGRYTPGTHIPVKAVEGWMNGSLPTHMVVLAWNFKDEIIAQMKPFSDRGGSFVLPIPEPRVL